MPSQRIAVVGAGGFARELAWLISDIAHDPSRQKLAAPMEVAGFLVSDATKVSKRDSEILGDFSWLEENHVDGLAMGIGSRSSLALKPRTQAAFPADSVAGLGPSQRQVSRVLPVSRGGHNRRGNDRNRQRQD